MGNNRSLLEWAAGLQKRSVFVAVLWLSAGALAPRAAAGPRSTDFAVASEPGSADAAFHRFVLRVCNRTPRMIWISLASRRTDAADVWFVSGWWKIDAHGCEELGRFARPTIYLHAENAEGRQWNGVDAKLCVQKNNFRYAYRPVHACDGVLRGFYEKTIDGSWSSFEWRVAE